MRERHGRKVDKVRLCIAEWNFVRGQIPHVPVASAINSFFGREVNDIGHDRFGATQRDVAHHGANASKTNFFEVGNGIFDFLNKESLIVQRRRTHKFEEREQILGLSEYST